MIHAPIKKWLRGAGDRDGGRTQRARRAFEASCNRKATHVHTPVADQTLRLVSLHWSMTSDCESHYTVQKPA